jgi:hypothetical protein
MKNAKRSAERFLGESKPMTEWVHSGGIGEAYEKIPTNKK